MAILGQTAIDQLKADHRKLKTIPAGHAVPARRPPDEPDQRRWAVLTDDLAAPADINNPTTAPAKLQHSPGVDEADGEITITHYWVGVSLLNGALIRVEPDGMDWIIYAAGC